MTSTCSRLAFVAVLALCADSAAAQQAPEDPCLGDAQRLCPDVKLGSGRVVACLRQNEEKLSNACLEKLEADQARAMALVQQFSRDCRPDIGQFCASVEPGEGRVLDCLDGHLPELTTGCQAQMTRLSRSRAQVEGVRNACRADVARLCQGVPQRVGALVQCLAGHAQDLSPGCDPEEARRAMQAAVLVDTLDEMSSKERIRESLQILQGLDSVAFARSQVLFQLDSFQSIADKGNGARFLFNPQFVFGPRNEFALQVKVPLSVLYPYAPGVPTQYGLGALVTAVAWNFANTGSFRHFAALGLQWPTASSPSVGGPWTLVPSYAVGAALARIVSLTVQVQWYRSLGSNPSYKTLNLLVLEPIVAVNLPGRSFLAVDTRLGWDIAGDSFVPLMKFMGGIFTDRNKSLSISAWYQAALTQPAADQYFKYSVGMGLAYFFDW